MVKPTSVLAIPAELKKISVVVAGIEYVPKMSAQAENDLRREGMVLACKLLEQRMRRDGIELFSHMDLMQIVDEENQTIHMPEVR